MTSKFEMDCDELRSIIIAGVAADLSCADIKLRVEIKRFPLSVKEVDARMTEVLVGTYRKPLSAGVEKLGESETQYYYDKPSPELLESFPNPFSLAEMNPNRARSTIEIVCPEFTSLCPKTGQPDFATIRIDYIPRKVCVESKSLKLYLGSFRNHGEFHESCVNRICNDLITLLDPEWVRVKGEFTPRGGIPFWPIAHYERPIHKELMPHLTRQDIIEEELQKK